MVVAVFFIGEGCVFLMLCFLGKGGDEKRGVNVGKGGCGEAEKEAVDRHGEGRPVGNFRVRRRRAACSSTFSVRPRRARQKEKREENKVRNRNAQKHTPTFS